MVTVWFDLDPAPPAAAWPPLPIPSLVIHSLPPKCWPPCAPCCSLSSFAGGVVIPKESVLTVPCDVLIPAAIGGVIDEDNARDLQCKVGCYH